MGGRRVGDDSRGGLGEFGGGFGEFKVDKGGLESA